MKSESDRGSSSPHTRLDDAGLSAVDEQSHWHLTINFSYTDTPHDMDNSYIEMSFIVNQQHPYSSKQIGTLHRNINLAVCTYHINRWHTPIEGGQLF